MSLSPTHRPTDTDTDTDAPTQYLSIRLTCPHNDWQQIESIILEGIDHYVAYPHIGQSEGGNPHWHIFVPAKNPREGDRIRNRIKRLYGNGNAVFSLKFMSNGLLLGLQYGGREKTRPMVGLTMQRWVDLAPEWVPKSELVTTKALKERLGSPTLTLGNLVKQALKFTREHYPECSSLTNCLSRMCEPGGWMPSRDLVTNGIHMTYHQMYLEGLGKKKKIHNWMLPHELSEKKKEWADRPVYDTDAILVPDPCIIQSGSLTI